MAVAVESFALKGRQLNLFLDPFFLAIDLFTNASSKAVRETLFYLGPCKFVRGVCQAFRFSPLQQRSACKLYRP